MRDINVGKIYRGNCADKQRRVRVESLGSTRVNIMCLTPCEAARRHLRPGVTEYACYIYDSEVSYEKSGINTLGNFPKKKEEV
jgi:hypothetical protein